MGYQAPVAVRKLVIWKVSIRSRPGIIGKKIVVTMTLRHHHWRDATRVLRTQRTSETRRLVAHNTRLSQGFGLLGRLKPGVSKETARAEMATLFKRAVDRPDANPFMRRMELRIEPAVRRFDASEPDALDTADGLDGSVGLSCCSRMREL